MANVDIKDFVNFMLLKVKNLHIVFPLFTFVDTKVGNYSSQEFAKKQNLKIFVRKKKVRISAIEMNM